MLNRYKFIYFIVLALCLSCKPSPQYVQLEQIEKSISALIKEFDIEQASYMVASVETDERIIAIGADIQFDKNILEPIEHPLALKILQNKSSCTHLNYVNNRVNLAGENIWKLDYSLATSIDRKELSAFYQRKIDSLLRQWPKSDIITADILTHKRQDAKSVLEKAYLISRYLQQPNISGFNKDTKIENRYKTDHLRGVYEYLGWKTMILNNQLLFWNTYKDNGNVIVLCNALNSSVFVGVVYPEGMLPSNFNTDCEDLYFNVFISTSLSALYQSTDFDSSGAINKFLKKKELKSRIEAYRFQKNYIKSESLKSTYQKEFPDDNSISWDYQKLITAINYVGDDALERRYFRIAKDTMVQLCAAGQTMTEIWGSDRVYGRDYINIVLRSRNSDRTLFRSKFYYKYPYINGSKVNTDPYPFAFKDIDNSQYYFEVSIDWPLDSIRQIYGKNIEFYIEIGDSDGNPRETKGSLVTSVENKILYFDSFKYSSDKSIIENRYSTVKTEDSVIIDGKPEDIWNQTYWNRLGVLLGDRDKRTDLSTSYKSLWNKDKLYFLFRITDQAKQYAWLQSKDYCRIVNANNGDLEWQIAGQRSEYFPFYLAENRFNLPKGEYYLEYVSDNRLSFANWYDKTLPSDYYGAFLFYASPDKGLN